MSISCPFCGPDPERVFLVRPRLLGIWDAFPVTPGHALIIPRRHFPDWAGATAEERQAILEVVDPVMKLVAKQHGPVDGFNLGINAGEAAGQTVPHLHVHIIPRRRGDVADPRGGVRHVIPEKGNYLAMVETTAPAAKPDIVVDVSPLASPSVAEALPPIEIVSLPEPAYPTEPAAEDQVRFLTQVQCLLDGGQFSATYKYALLLALADLAVERGCDDAAELALSTETIAEKFIEYYWGHCRPFVAPTAVVSTQAAPPLLDAPAAPKPAKPKLEKVVSLLTAVYAHVDGKLPALRANEVEWTKVLKSVRTVVQSTPLWKLQTIADSQVDFLYPSVGRGSTITLRPGIAFCFRRFHGLVGNLVRGAWVDWVRGQNRELVGDAADLEEFLFGAQRRRLREVAPVLYELQRGRCFYTGKELPQPDQGEVDHFIPFARYAHDYAHNLVLASKRANADKSDHLAAEDHLAAWAERNATGATPLTDACTAAGISSDLERTLAVARWAYTQADRSETPVWTTASDLERRLSGRWRAILGCGIVTA